MVSAGRATYSARMAASELGRNRLKANLRSTDSSGSRASATRIRFESELSGLVGLVDVAGGSFTLLGQRVTVDESTVFDERLSGGPAGLYTGQPVEEVERVLDRDHFMTSEEAKDWGIVDHVYSSREGTEDDKKDDAKKD